MNFFGDGYSANVWSPEIVKISFSKEAIEVLLESNFRPIKEEVGVSYRKDGNDGDPKARFADVESDALPVACQPVQGAALPGEFLPLGR